MLTKIVFFNHKGGVSKTTTAYNLGWMLAKQNKRVLLVDADPQCNLTSLILGDELEEYYTNTTTKDHNIKDGVRVAFEARPRPIEAVNCPSVAENDGLFLLAGHTDLSEYEASLSFAQTTNNALATLMHLPGAFNALIERTSETYNIDFVLIDLNPSLSAINQNLFTLSDAFIVPTNPDPFSAMAVTTLAKVLPRWVQWAKRSQDIFKDSAYPLSDSSPKFIGTVIQKFNIRKGKATQAARNAIDNIKNITKNTLIPSLNQAGMLFDQTVYSEANMAADYCLAEIPDFQSMIHKAHEIGKPVFDLTDQEIRNLNITGAVLDSYKDMRNRYRTQFEYIAQQLITLSNHVHSSATAV